MTVGTINGNARYAHVDPEYRADLGQRLGELRIARKMTQRKIAGLLNCDHSAVSLIENNKYPSLTEDMARRIEDVLSLASQGYEAWFMPYLQVERTATILRSWEPLAIPGLLQTEAYAWWVIRGANPGRPDTAIGEVVAKRMRRQEIWSRADPAPPFLAAIIGEAALRQVPEPAVMREQVAHLLLMAANPRVSIQVLPFGAPGHGGQHAPFVVASFDPDPKPDVANLDNALDGETVSEREQVTTLFLLYDALSRRALRERESEDFIKEMAGQWT